MKGPAPMPLEAPNQDSVLPEFERPPVVETVLGVQFAPVSGLRAVDVGAYWKDLGPDWPKAVEREPIAEQFEVFDENQRLMLQLELGMNMPQRARVQISNRSGEWMIQVQATRFHVNWIQVGNAQYPRYEATAARFMAEWATLSDFLKKQGLANELRVNQWEVTYVNRIPKGGVWNSPSDWNRVFRNAPPIVDPEIDNFKLESFTNEWHYLLPDNKGRLHARLMRVAASGKGQNVVPEHLQFHLTARGPLPQNSTNEELRAGLDFGRSAIVRGFAALTSPDAHMYWGKVGG